MSIAYMRVLTSIRTRAPPCAPLTTKTPRAATATGVISPYLTGTSATSAPSATRGASSPASRGTSCISSEASVRIGQPVSKRNDTPPFHEFDPSDAFQADGTWNNWFAHLPATSTHRDDVQSFIFRELSHHSYQSDDCAGNYQSETGHEFHCFPPAQPSAPCTIPRPRRACSTFTTRTGVSWATRFTPVAR